MYFAVQTLRDCLEEVWIEARTAERPRRRLFEHVRAISAPLVFPDWNTLMQTLVDADIAPDIEALIAG